MNKDNKMDKIKELKKASESLIDFMNKYCCPHDVVIVQQGHIELLNGEIGIPTKILD